MSSTPFDWTREWVQLRGLRHWFADSLESTNTFAKADETEAPHSPVISKVSDPSLYFARTQTSGRGRGTNSWIAAEESLLSSWSYRLANSPQPILSPLVGLALHDALRRSFAGIDLSLKAPNDVYSGDKKIAGLLIETIVTGPDVKVVVGLGLNVMAPPSGVETAGALASKTQITREAFLTFLDKLRDEFARALVAGQAPGLRADVRARLRDALNAFPLLPDPVLEVDDQGQIRTSRGFVHWHQL